VKFTQPDDDELDRWLSPSHGGWSTAELRGSILPTMDADIRSAYPAAWCLLGCWVILRANRLRQRSVLRELRRLAERVAAGDFAPLFDPITYREFGLTLVTVIFDGEPWPVELYEADGSRLVIVPATSSQPMYVAWPTVLLAAALSGRVPRILSAVKIEPDPDRGFERTRPLSFVDGVVVPAGEDPVPVGVRLRSRLKDEGDERLPVQLRVLLNAMAWGVFARLDQRRVGGKLVESPARWTWPPIAATVPAVAQLWLAMVERMVRDVA
jgi:hypothetical protein